MALFIKRSFKGEDLWPRFKNLKTNSKKTLSVHQTGIRK